MAQLSAQTGCNVLVTDPPYSADASGLRDSSAAFNAAIEAAGTGGLLGSYLLEGDLRPWQDTHRTYQHPCCQTVNCADP